MGFELWSPTDRASCRQLQVMQEKNVCHSIRSFNWSVVFPLLLYRCWEHSFSIQATEPRLLTDKSKFQWSVNVRRVAYKCFSLLWWTTSSGMYLLLSSLTVFLPSSQAIGEAAFHAVSQGYQFLQVRTIFTFVVVCWASVLRPKTLFDSLSAK